MHKNCNATNCTHRTWLGPLANHYFSYCRKYPSVLVNDAQAPHVIFFLIFSSPSMASSSHRGHMKACERLGAMATQPRMRSREPPWPRGRVFQKLLPSSPRPHGRAGALLIHHHGHMGARASRYRPLPSCLGHGSPPHASRARCTSHGPLSLAARARWRATSCSPHLLTTTALATRA